MIADLPQPHPQPLTRTSAAAQVAWLWLSSPDHLDLVAIDGQGRQVARLGILGNSSVLGRSADGSQILIADDTSLTAYSALNGHALQQYRRSGGQIVGHAVSPDSRYLALLVFDAGRLRLEAVEMASGLVLGPVDVVHAADAAMPGMQGPPSAWATATFAANSREIYTLSDWGDRPHISSFSLAGGSLRQVGTAPVAVGACGGPSTSINVVDAGATVAAFCHFNGSVWLIDLKPLGKVAVLHPLQSNPFAASPVFTPDGQILYVVEGQRIQAIDLHRQQLVDTTLVSMHERRSVLSWIAALFIRDAEAGWVASTVPIAPDGLTLYLGASDGIVLLRIPDLKRIGRLSPGVVAGEIWVSGDGQTLFATSDDGHRLAVITANGSRTTSVTLPAAAAGFVSSEHG
ncbi:MAG TPA: hypothetical protein VG104_01225 [Candidatus Dormibacteraeota bacterium]|nr:hypothetical protein [Candidatus Dormibacteraeota bacterium]